MVNHKSYILKTLVLNLSLLISSLTLISCAVEESANVNNSSAEEIVMSASLESENKQQNWCFQLQVPDSNWTIKLDSIYQLENGKYNALAHVWRKPGSGMQVISTLSICAPVDIEAADVSVLITGKGWGWQNNEAVTFVKAWPVMNKNQQLIFKADDSTPPTKPEPGGNPDR